MRGFDNEFAARLREEAEFVTEGAFPGQLYRIDWFPGAVYEAGSEQVVHGEIYEIAQPETLLAALDEYEGMTEDESISLYLRREVPVTTASGRVLSCLTYLYNQSTADLLRIRSGRFRI